MAEDRKDTRCEVSKYLFRMLGFQYLQMDLVERVVLQQRDEIGGDVGNGATLPQETISPVLSG